MSQKFYNFLDKHFVDEVPRYSKVYFSLLGFSAFFFIFAFFLFSSLIQITNDLVQKENVLNIDQNKTYYINSSLFPQSQSYEDYYRDLIVIVPRRVYFYFCFCFITILFYIENFIYFIQLYFKQQRVIN